jgi:hypothetical protein
MSTSNNDEPCTLLRFAEDATTKANAILTKCEMLMISDVLCEAITDLEYCEGLYPGSYQAVAVEVQAVTTVMRTVRRHLDHPPIPHPTLPAYLKKVNALRASVRRISNHGQRPWYEEGPPEGADYVR